MDAIQTIQSMLAPAMMISSCGLLFLGLQNRYGRIVDRLRQFNREKEDSPSENLKVLEIQIRQLALRGKLQRNALSCLLFAVIFFICTSFLILISIKLAIVSFLIGMVSVLAGVVFAWFELITSYRTVMMETENETA